MTPTEPPEDVAGTIKHALRLLLVATVVLYLALFGVAYVVYRNGDTNRAALCALRWDLEKRVAGTQQLLIDHPEGLAGIPAQTLKDGITNQQRTIEALRGVHCSSPGID
jgi:hypothetical protein